MPREKKKEKNAISEEESDIAESWEMKTMATGAGFPADDLASKILLIH